MMRLPTTFRYVAPPSLDEAARVLAGEGPSAMVVAGGTDLYPNMKRRHQMPATLVGLRRLESLRGAEWEASGALTIGAGTILRALERDEGVKARLPALWSAVASISTPLLRNMGTIGGNVCLDTRCNYYDQSYEWRRAIDFCMKCEGTTCWTAPGSERCLAVNSSDSVPVLIALGAKAHLVSASGERDVRVADLFREDGIHYLTKRPDEILTRLAIPPQGAARSVYRKVRRRGSFDFPVLGVAVRVDRDGDVVRRADVVLNAVGSAPVVCEDAQAFLAGKPLSDEVIAEAAARAHRLAKPLDNTDHMAAYRKRMVKVEVGRALASLR